MQRNRLELENGKYTVVEDSGAVFVLRHGEEWRNITRDKFVLSMVYEIEELRDRLYEAEDLLHDARITLDSMHGYDSQVYEDIGEYFHGGNDE